MTSSLLKIGIDCRLVDKKKNTGISRYTQFLIEYYVSRYSENELYLVTNNREFTFKNCNIVFTSLKPYNIIHFICFSFKMRDRSFNLFHSPFYSGFFLKPNYPVITTVHDLMYRIVPDFFGKSKVENYLKIIYFDFIIRRSLRNSKKTVSVSETTKNDLLGHFKHPSCYVPENSEIVVRPNFEV
jgi:hypothetical protein